MNRTTFNPLNYCAVTFSSRRQAGSRIFKPAAIAAGLALAVFVPSALAANWAWSTVPGSANFSGANWTNSTIAGPAMGTPSSGDSLYFGTSSQLSPNNDDSSFTFGGLTFNSGASVFTIGGNAFSLAGGITNNSASAETINNNITLTANQTVNANSKGITLGGIIGDSGSGYGLTLAGANSITLTGTSTYTGATTLSSSATFTFSGSGGVTDSIFYQGVQGSGVATYMADSPTAAGTVTRSAGYVYNGVSLGGNNFNNFTINGTSAGNTVEQFGALTLNSGGLFGTIAANSAANVQVVFSGVTRNPGTALYFGRSASGIGANSISSQTANAGNIVFTNPPVLVGGSGVAGNPNIAIVPWADLGTGNRVTYDSTNGLRGLGGGETVNLTAGGFVGVNGTTNVNTASVTLTGNSAVNSMGGGGTVGLGGYTLTIASGTIMAGTATIIGASAGDGTLALGAEGHFFAENTRALTINSVITGTGGLTINLDNDNASTASCVLAATNTFTGVTTVEGNNTALDLHLNSSLALENSTLNYNNYGASVVFGTATCTLGGLEGAQNLGLPSTSLTIGSSGDSDVADTYSGVLSGSGSALIKAGSTKLTLSGANTYTGGITLNAGVLNAGIAQNGSTSGPLGASGTISFGGGTLQYSAANQQDYSPRFSTAGGQLFSIDANGQTVSFASALISSGGSLTLTNSTGTGKLTLSAAGNTYSGATIIQAGTLALGASATLPNSSVTVSNGATFDVSALSFTLGSGQNLLGFGSVNGAVTTSAGSAIYPGLAGVVGTLPFNSTLNMSAGGAVYFDVSTSHSSGNDQVRANNLTLSSSDTIHIDAVNGASPLDTAADYILFAVTNTPTMTTTPTLVFDGTQPSNYANFIVQKSGNNIVLHYNVTSSPTVMASLSPNSVVRGQSVTVTATVTPGSGTVTNVGINLSPIGGSAAVSLVLSNANVYTNTFAVGTGTLVGSQSLTVSATDTTPLTGTASPTLTVNASTDVWDGLGGNNSWSTGANWVSTYAPGLTGDSLVFSNNVNTSPGMNNSYTVNAVSFDSSSASFNIGTSGSTLTLNGSVTNYSANPQTMNVPVVLGGAVTLNAAAGNLTLGQTLANGGNLLTVAGANNTTISNAVSGGGGVTMSGNGTLLLAGNNSYAGPTMVNAGTVALSGNNTSASGATTDSGTLQLQNANALAGSALTLNSGSTLVLLADTNTVFTNTSFTMNTGGNNNITVNGLTGAGNGRTLTIANNAGLGSSTTAVNVTSTSGDTLAFGSSFGVTANGTSAWGGGETDFYLTNANVILNGMSANDGGMAVSGTTGSSLTINGNAGNPSASRTLYAKVNNGILTLNDTYNGTASGANWGFQAILNGGTLNLNNANAINSDAATSGHGSTLATLEISGGTLDNTSGAVLTLNNPTVAINSPGSFTFQGSTNLNLGAGAVVMNTSGQITVAANMLTVGGVISDGGSGYSLTLAGGGTLTLTGVNTYSGGTVVNGGILALNAALTGTTATGVLTVNDGGTLAVTASDPSQLTPSTLILGSVNGATNDFANVTGTTTAPVSTGSLNVNGASVINILSGSFAAGQTYPLITYSGESINGTLTLGSLPNGVTANLQDTGSGLIQLNVTAVSPEIWTGAHNGTWDIGTSLDWKINGSPTTYADGSLVVFDDSAAGTTTITNIAPVSPSSVTFSNNSKTYSFTGGVIGGSGALTLNGTGTVILANTDTYASGTTINAGTLQLGDGVANDGAVAGNISDNGSLVFAGPQDQTFAGVISGAGNLTKTNANNLTLPAANVSFSGNVAINAGTVSFSDPNGLGTGAVTLGDAASGANATMSLTANITFADNLTIAAGAGARTISAGSGMTLTGTFTGGGNLTLTNGTGIVFLTGPGSPGWTGNCIIAGGTVRVGGQWNSSTVLSISTNNGGTFNYGGGTVVVTLAGINDIPGASGGSFTGGSSGGDTMVLEGGGSYTYSGVYSGIGGLNVSLATGGIQTFTGANTYTGNTTINGGTLALSGSGSITSPNIYLAGGAEFDVSGLSSTFGLATGQTLNGTGGTGTLKGGVNLSSGSLTLDYTGGTPTLNVIGGALNFSGNAVTVTVTGSQLPDGTYLLISTGTGGSVTGTLPSSVTVNGAGAADASSLQITGGQLYLVVGSGSVIATSISGSTLMLSWPAGAGWYLQAQTNTLSTGIGNNWVTVQGVPDGSYTTTIDPSKGAVFYRLSQSP